ncbi:MAG: SRPBCC family protein [Gemmatimonadaceae bacterium]
MLLYILGGLAAVIVLIILFASTRPSTFSLVRSTTIGASPDRVFPLINDFHKWSDWSPWEKIDPAMKRAFTGPESGVGAAYSWDGNNKAGAGSMQITRSDMPNKVDINLNFTRPFKANNLTEFTTAPSGNSTVVTWKMSGPLDLFGKVFHLFVNMEKMVGTDFEKGLASMKAIAER